ncbi:3-deoxy-manno-octulosonate cytidylyltransferase [Thiomicrorhabdus xiamenensis]|uniref:3-deoxy-manno-octulosonate cytidylyltransferase n=1 Tax=Thiomicrorhabdus xiamenensis TaxID=2739063 RepID=A0A7D4NPN2_9GAMM|nr:3-deoxy-manno-octulosonate cytidylyltransferase [Thiomicrorhabdus xiamenensis]QKI89773.1 3-deoxy-manno-octulosonate cytidylyltransferase [Thiomicrorhabdus xiamenensis]
MKTIVVIPARYKSSRFPGKPLVKLLGKPMIQWVAELSARAVGKDNVYIATDDIQIESAVLEMGYQVVMTSEECLTGTDRLAEVAKKIEADVYINVQGDEPLVDPEDILKVIEAKKIHMTDVINGYSVIGKNEDPQSVNIPKVIFTEDERLVYMSRQALPGFKEEKNAPLQYYKQVCIYAFNRQELLAYGEFGRKSILEQSEDIEIIRFLEWGQPIRMVETRPGSLAVDVPEDVERVEAALREHWG